VWQNQKCPKKQLTFEVGAGVKPTTAQTAIMAAKTACCHTLELLPEYLHGFYRLFYILINMGPKNN
jgi:hypothetical protein